MCNQTNTTIGPWWYRFFAHIIRLHSDEGNKTQLPRDLYETESMWWYIHLRHTATEKIWQYTVKPVCNDHLYNEIYYLWFIQ